MGRYLRLVYKWVVILSILLVKWYSHGCVSQVSICMGIVKTGF